MERDIRSMKKWRGMDIYECPECGYSAVDKEQYEIHTAQTGHEKINHTLFFKTTNENFP